ncbi:MULTISPECIES: acetolactate synthase small subunit [Paraglaciecola]|jgi:acetolactate synthase-1/3 small subunit|uniref:Acetolactate synthase small subunit n=4 Tax=Paraglaciecola TaxID=1621534 RepID=A0A8H9I7C4_9ALTE|nr:MULTISPECIES: acetolactate synthase small subunit [Paraglaciecola]AEE21659.1 acetolactate synthase, small subunit [Glaciecola sp. 4H-3-7+YE-5]MBN24282.1 acetolactate synthase small subunit [Alteromonadaceae bacterium]MBJ2138704.1 acetolactate synthase small subunit [Paraglaciecola chathamensis]MBU3019008.1 acetolactate synthase small subunit [Paraglaciecola agarilytica]MDO6557999.1 acetolactate synthase small subunit [Paraglaciecola chathamensis]|tara:strand:+ start:27557 stop:28054 length:498 start_codon:yes stop_codon:yes gene_type:complete
MKRIISVLMENAPGALSRIVGVFSQRGYNVDSLCVAATDDKSLSRLTITTQADDKVIEQITKQVNKLIDVLKVTDLTNGSHVERELMLIKVATRSELVRAEVNRNVDIFRAQIIDVDLNNYTIQVTGTSDKLDAFANVLAQSTEIIEASRTGICGLARGDKALRP